MQRLVLLLLLCIRQPLGLPVAEEKMQPPSGDPSFPAELSIESEKPRTAVLRLVPHAQVSYFTTITIGNEPFKVLVDSASSGLWVRGSHCVELGTCKKTDTPFFISYVSGNVSGEIVDTVDVELGGMILHDQRVDIGRRLDGRMEKILRGMDGVFGLDRFDCGRCFIHTAFPAWPKKISRMFTMDLRTGKEKLTIGDIGLEKYENRIRWTDQKKHDTKKWFTYIESAKLGEIDIPFDLGTIAHTDSGSSLIAAPRHIAIWILKQMGYDYHPEKRAFFLTEDCPDLASLPDLTITVRGNLTVIVRPADYIYEWNNDSCYVLIDALSPSLEWEADWVLGLPYLRQVQQVLDFENNRLGLTEANALD